jgi:pimeloyl-ACP methyl ester carboxylesterase
MRSRFFTGLGTAGFHRLHYTERGDPAAPTVVCVHGLTQNARGFDALAEALAPTRHVVCLDVAGRGRSARLADPGGYDYPQYLADVNALFARLDVDTVDFVGTSMGGLIGMFLAAMPATRSAASSSTMSARSSRRRRWRASATMSATISALPMSPRWRRTCARPMRRSAR